MTTGTTFTVDQGHSQSGPHGQMRAKRAVIQDTYSNQVLDFLAVQGGIAKEKLASALELVADPIPRQNNNANTTDETPVWTTNLVPREMKDLVDVTPITDFVSSQYNNIADMFLITDMTLSEAAYKGNVEAMRRVINRENVNERDVEDLSKFTPLHLAARAGHDDAVKLLLEYGADSNAKDSWNGTPFHSACAEGHTQSVTAMLEKKADINALNNFAQTPLDLAVKHGKQEVIRTLYILGAETGETVMGKIMMKQHMHAEKAPPQKANNEAAEQSTWGVTSALEQLYEWNYRY